MIGRRGFLGRAIAIASGVLPVAAAKPAQSARDFRTIRGGDVLCHGVKEVQLNGVPVKMCTAWNVAEGWTEEFDKEATQRLGYIVEVRRFGKVTYTLGSA